MKNLRRIVFLLMSAVMPAQMAFSDSSGTCEAQIGQWLNPSTGEPVDNSGIFDSASRAPVVLLGETHTSMDHHRWQLQVLSGLLARNPNMVIGLEMMPRRMQAILDEWSAGRLSELEFLRRSEWNTVWGYDADLYLPLLHFARLNRLPLVALNVDRSLISQVADSGWDSVPAEDRQGLGDPAAASDAYRRQLAGLYVHKQRMGIVADGDGQDAPEPDLDSILDDKRFSNFVEAQVTWDRAMAEALQSEHARDPDAIVVGIVGSGHIEFGYGIPHQLDDLGINAISVLVPLDASDECSALPANIADAVFVIDEEEAVEAAKPRLGVLIDSAENGVRVMDVVEGSVAELAGLADGDIIRFAAGFATRDSATLVEIIQRQAPGTWLPLEIVRGGQTIDITAKFPQKFE